MIKIDNQEVKNVMIGNQQVKKVMLDGQVIWEIDLDNLLSNDPDFWEMGCWTAQIGTTLQPTEFGSAAFRIRPKQGVIPVPAGSRVRFKTNFHGIFVVRIVGANHVIFANPAQLHDSNTEDGAIIQLTSTQIGIALSLSNLPHLENSVNASFEIWMNRLVNNEVVPELTTR